MNATFLPPQKAPYTFPALPPDERRPIRVLSLFDGIASGKYENGLALLLQLKETETATLYAVTGKTSYLQRCPLLSYLRTCVLVRSRRFRRELAAL